MRAFKSLILDVNSSLTVRNNALIQAKLERIKTSISYSQYLLYSTFQYTDVKMQFQFSNNEAYCVVYL